MTELEIAQVPVANLVPYRNNARIHSEAQIELIAGSIQRFGFLNPVIANRKTRTVIAGHGRLMAAKQLGMAEVPVILVDSIKNERAYIIADNRIAEDSFWDNRMLAEALQGLSKDQAAATGLSDAELAALADALLPQFEPPPADEGEEDEGDAAAEEAPGGEKEPKVYDVRATLGEYKASIPRVKYDQLVRDLRIQFNYDEELILAEIQRRLGL